MSDKKEYREELLKKTPIDYKNFRKRAGAPLKFNDERKALYLELLEKHGKKGLCAKMVDMAPSTIMDHEEEDPVFAELVQVALSRRSERIVKILEEEAINGHTHTVFDKDGNQLSTKQVYETQLRLAMLKRYDSAYNDKGDFNLNHNVPVGAVVVPAAVPAEDWEKLYGEKAKGTYRPDLNSGESE